LIRQFRPRGAIPDAEPEQQRQSCSQDRHEGPPSGRERQGVARSIIVVRMDSNKTQNMNAPQPKPCARSRYHFPFAGTGSSRVAYAVAIGVFKALEDAAVVRERDSAVVARDDVASRIDLDALLVGRVGGERRWSRQAAPCVAAAAVPTIGASMRGREH